MSFPCPNCGHRPTRVKDSRVSVGPAVRRRRECGACGERFTTREAVTTAAEFKEAMATATRMIASIHDLAPVERKSR